MGQARLLMVGVGLLLGVLAAALWLLEDQAPTGGRPSGPAVVAGGGRPGGQGPDGGRTGQELVAAGEDGTQLVVVEPAPEAPAVARFDRSWLDRDLLRTQRVTGRVLDDDGQPIADARLLLAPDPGRLLLALGEQTEQLDPTDFSAVRSRSQADGRFAMLTELLVPPSDGSTGVAALLVQAEGFASQVRNVSVTLEAEHDVGDVSLYRGCSVSGRAVDEQGRPLEGVQVVLSNSTRSQRSYSWRRSPEPVVGLIADALLVREGAVTTGSDGRFLVPGLRSSRGSLELSWQGGPAVELERLRADDDEEQLDVGDVLVPVGRLIAGRLTDDQGRPLSGARVHVSDDEPVAGAISADESLRRVLTSGPLSGVVCDAEGRFVLSGLERPAYTLYAVAPGRATLRRDGVAPGGAPLELSLAPVAVWTLEVVDHEQQPVPAAELAVDVAPWRRALAPLAGLSRVPPEPAVILADGAPGRFRVAGLPAELCLLTASAEGLGARAVVGRDLEPDEAGVRRLVLTPLAGLTGTVGHGPERTPVAGARVDLSRLGDLDAEGALSRQRRGPELYDPARNRVAVTAADGSFRFDDLPQGLWRAHVRAEGFLPYLAVRDGEAETVTIDPAAEAATLAVTLHRSSRVQGLLLDHNGRPQAGRSVRLKKGVLREQSGSVRDRTDSDGRFTFADLAAGVHTVWADEALAQQVQVTPGPPSQVQLILAPPAVVQGTLLHADGTSGGGRVAFQVADPDQDAREGQRDQRRSANVDEQGRFRAEVRVDGALWATGMGAQGQSTPERQLSVAPGGSYSLELRFPATRLAGRVVDATTDAPLAQARITLRTDGKRLSLRTDADGRFDVPGLRGGIWRLSATHEGYESAGLSDLVVVDPDAPAVAAADEPPPAVAEGADEQPDPGPVDDLRVALTPKAASARLHGTVVQADGSLVYDGTTVVAEAQDESGKGNMMWGGPRGRTLNGEYHIDSLEPGLWELVVRRSVVAADGSSQQVELVRRSVSLLPGDDLRVDLQLAEAPSEPPPSEPTTPDADVLKQLQALGYLGG